MWIEKRRQQHRAYWRKRIDGKDYEAFGTKTQAQEFIDLCNKFGRDKVVARHRARGLEQAPTVVSAPTTPGVPAGVQLPDEFDPLHLLPRNPCTPLGLIRPEPEKCV